MPSQVPAAKKRQALSLADKIEIIKRHDRDENAKHEEIAIEFNCGCSTVTKILMDREKWLAEAQKGSNPMMQKQREAAWVKLEEALIIWLNQASSANLIISDEIIRMKVFGI